jgi:anaphase-promoting complex subunit 1
MALGFKNHEPPSSFSTPVGHRRNRSHLRSSSGAQIDFGDWDSMHLSETPNSATHPSWIENRGWQWVIEEDDAATSMFQPSQGRQEELSFFVSHLKHAQAFMASSLGEAACGQAGYIPTTEGIAELSRIRAAQDILTALHWLLEEQKLNISGYHGIPPGLADLQALVLQVTKWLRWHNWILAYELEMPVDFSDSQGSLADAVVSKSVPEPPLWNVLEWAQVCLTHADSSLAIPPGISAMPSDVLSQTRLLARLFQALKTRGRSPVDFVEAMYESGITSASLESFPESILVPLQDAISQCRSQPPPTWSRTLLDLVDRGDVGSVLSPHDGSQLYSSSLMVSHNRH